MLLFLIIFMISLLTHGGFWCYGFVGNEIWNYIIKGIIENWHFLIKVRFMESSFPVNFMNWSLDQINISFIMVLDFTYTGVLGLNV